MATYQFSALTSGQAIAFVPSADLLNFDQTAISAASIGVSAEGANTRITVLTGTAAGKTVVLENTSPLQLAQVNVTFANGSFIRFGDNAVAMNDNASNTLFGGGGADLMAGFGGNDSLNGGSGNDWVEGGAGNDTLSGSGGQDMFVFREAGAADADTLNDFASNWDSFRFDLAGLSELGAVGRFAAGDVRFWSAAGATAGHDADDRLIFNTTTRQLFYDADGSGAGASQLVATLANTANVTAADIWVFGTAAPTGPAPINGTAGNDSIVGTDGNDTINGLGGNDTLVGIEGADVLNGGDGDDVLDGRDRPFQPTTQPETLDGGAGNDLFWVDDVGDSLADASGTDTVRAVDISWTLGAGFENLIIDNDQSEFVVTGTGNGLANVIDVREGWGAVVEALGGHDTVFGSTQEDTLSGGTENDVLDGGWDFDSLGGGAGNDTLYGGEDDHRDTLEGGSGADTFVLRPDHGGIQPDFVDDFIPGTDKIRLDGSFIANVGPSGNFSAGDERFYAAADATGAHDSTDRFIYNTTTGEAWYDEDGTGSAMALRLADFAGMPLISATDIEVVNGQDPTVMNGTAGNDTLIGDDDANDINGFGGHDLLIGNAGDDSLNGGDGNDTMDAIAGTQNPYRSDAPEQNTVSGGLGDDVFIVWGSDVLQDSGGLDRVVVASAGSYTLPEGFENVRLAFNAETDEHFTLNGNSLGNIILPRSSRNTIDAGAGNDRVYGGDDRDNISGGDGDDFLHGGGFFNTLTGNAGADHFVFDTDIGFQETAITDFASGVDKIHLDVRVMAALGATGNFTSSDARFFAGAGATGGADATDRVVYDTTSGALYYDADGNGAGGAVFIAQLLGAPVITAADIVVENGGLPGAVIYGTNIDEASAFDSFDEFINGTPYNDTMIGLAGNDVLDGGHGNDSIEGGDGDDLLVGREGNDTLLGGAGNDIFDLPWTFPNTNSSGADLIDGGAGFDTVRFNFAGTATSGIVVNLAAGTVTGGSPGGSATLTSIEGADGASFADSMLGGAGGNRFFGEEGADTLNGAAGNDTLTGGGGADAFILANAPGAANEDLITDFTSGTDKLRLDGSVMTALGGSGDFSAGDARFFAGAGATSGQDASDRVIYNTTTQELFYDADGSGGGASLLIARLQNPSGPVALQATDIAVDNGSVTPPPPPPGSTIFGTGGNDSMNGTAGNDTMNGGSGNDSIAGGAGNDSISGSGGQDTFVFREAGATSADRITDFASNWDRFFLDNAGLTGLGTEGRFTAGDVRFWSAAGASTAHDADDRVVFNTTTRELWYDADGAGGDAAQLIATLTNTGNVVAADITVI